MTGVCEENAGGDKEEEERERELPREGEREKARERLLKVWLVRELATGLAPAQCLFGFPGTMEPDYSFEMIVWTTHPLTRAGYVRSLYRLMGLT